MVSSEKQSKKQSEKHKNVIVTIPRFEPFEFSQLKTQLVKKYGAVLFWPFYDNGETYGYAIPWFVRKMEPNEKVLQFDERLVREIALANATKGKKTWIEMQSWGITTVKI